VIVATMTASVGFEQNSAPNGEFYVLLDPKYVDRLRAVRKPGESFSDVIVRVAEASEGA
jgi:hypothetical protein